jgi:hypothetical protein
MKNHECIVTIYSDNFKQIWHKEKPNSNWIQITNGIEREATSEQLLSHLLPLLSENYNGKFKIKVNKK